jgi:DNA-binding IclR family transcriptional regulator
MPRSAPPSSPASWTFLTNHAHVLVCLARDPQVRMRDLAIQIGITERAVQRLVHDLISDGYLKVDKDGRRNHYTVVDRVPLRHPVEAHRTVRDLLALLR